MKDSHGHLTDDLLGCHEEISPIVEKHMQKQMEHRMKTWVKWGACRNWSAELLLYPSNDESNGT